MPPASADFPPPDEHAASWSRPPLATRPRPAPFLEQGLARGGECGRLIARHDWQRTSLGPIETWPDSLQMAVSMTVCSSVPMVVLWGAEGVMVYNDAYGVICGRRHPRLLGELIREGWPEARDFNDRIMTSVLGGERLSFVDLELSLERNGQAEQVWMSLEYSPLLGDDGAIAGVLAMVVETTGKVRAERRVQGERERLRRMFAQAPGFMAMLSGPDHVVELANPAFMQLVGERSIIGRPVGEALPELAGQDFVARLARVFASGEPARFAALSLDLRRQGGGVGEQRFVDAVMQPVRGDAGAIEGIFIQGSDVTDRIAAEEAARLHDAQFRGIAQVLPNQVWTASAAGKVDWINRKALEYSGLADSSLSGSGWLEWIHPDDRATATRRWSEALATGRTYEAELRLRRSDGAFRWHLARAVALRDGAGHVVRWIGSSTDIEEQKRAAEVLGDVNLLLERRLAERTADRDRLWRLSTDVMLVADFEARIVSVNPALTALLGWSQNELVGRRFLDFVHPEDIEATLAETGRLATGLPTLRFQNRYRRRDGSFCRLSWTAVPDERFVHAVGRDMTADLEAADALKRTEAALHQAQKMESVGQLTGGVAHDFNNLLQVISANLQLLSRRIAADERSLKYVSSALDGVRRGARLASQLLAFARRQPLQPQVVDVGELVKGMEELLQRTLGETVEIATVVEPGLWPCDVDPAQVENALLNLALNARDAMEGGGRLTIEVANEELDEVFVRDLPDLAAGPCVVLTVTDTGAGIPQEIIGRVFEPFFSTKPDGKGTGLGLSMVYGFVRQSGGQVKVSSEVGCGTAVKLYLPRATGSAASVSVLTAAVPIAPSSRDDAGGLETTILVVEDDGAVRASAVEMLRQLGYRVLQAHDAATALRIIEAGEAIDLLFTDVVMPGPLRSPELARIASERLPSLAVLFTSGYTQNGIVHGGRLDPGVELIGKPYTQEALAARVRHLLTARKRLN